MVRRVRTAPFCTVWEHTLLILNMKCRTGGYQCYPDEHLQLLAIGHKTRQDLTNEKITTSPNQ